MDSPLKPAPHLGQVLACMVNDLSEMVGGTVKKMVVVVSWCGSVFAGLLGCAILRGCVG